MKMIIYHPQLGAYTGDSLENLLNPDNWTVNNNQTARLYEISDPFWLTGLNPPNPLDHIIPGVMVVPFKDQKLVRARVW